ncbi:methyltransferase domain-containing protein [Alteromonas sp. ASW11-19]|uniref:Methyltransferase domain-containing protein n=1 Tax=Alteromonas salexigens TaxID=2982530 RepID=A0ABT2VLM6_9ALTE|nr:methyltransferase domain-containing protein [Alteromonas salexigens]MCU7554221.1 methyltransferase domain-containing protein [Alteromonas salexigens]
MWQCPLCPHSLETSGNSWTCENNHTFDVAKAGYVNLLPVQFKKSLQPGDDKAMLQARREFHARGSYAPLMHAMSELLLSHIPAEAPVTLFDAGCGEGAYLRHVDTALQEANHDVHACGSDIAKVAVEMASKQARHHQYVVASSHQLPVRDNSVTAMLQVFAPGKDSEYARVLSEQGVLLTVDPGPEHLIELKRAVYDTPKRHEAPASYTDALRCVDEQQVNFNLTLQDPAHADALLAMTPYTWKLQPARRTALREELTQVTASFCIRLWTPDTHLQGVRDAG